MKDVPAYVKVSEFAKACDLKTINARRMLRKNHMIQDFGIGQVVDAAKVREKFPGYYQKLYEYFVLGET